MSQTEREKGKSDMRESGEEKKTGRVEARRT